ncbi:MAG: NAD(P)/FAD-dependent oxidoreductase [Methanoregulaceae archaeon]|nr:NAD(P)/FAD-dependent oxidoreductase [Methanoregulaceae archaeon]
MTERRQYDVVVVGAGPAGSTCARRCAELGLSTCMIEEHAAIGYPVQCAGLLSVRAFGACQVSKKAVLHEVSGARIITSRGSELAFDSGRTKAFVVDRGLLDREMAAAAADAGAEVRVKTAFVKRSGSVVVTRGIGGREEIPFRVLVAADGPRSPVAHDLGMARPPVFLAGIQAEVPKEMAGDLVEIYPDASPDFFGWIIPSGKGRARIGLAGREQVASRFSRFIKEHGGESCCHLVTGTIPLGVMPRTYGYGTLFVGDAAGFPKPTSGGGVYTGVRSAYHAAETAYEACNEGSTADDLLSRYEKRWRSELGRELELGFRLFGVRRNLTGEEVDRLVRVLNDPSLKSEILEYGDMDQPGVLLRRILKNPKIYPVLGILLRSGVRQIIK